MNVVKMANKKQLLRIIKETKRLLKSPIHRGRSVNLYQGKFDRDREDFGVAVCETDYYLNLEKCQSVLHLSFQ